LAQGESLGRSFALSIQNLGCTFPQLYQPHLFLIFIHSHQAFSSISSIIMPAQNSDSADAPPLTKLEKDYLAKHWGGEYKFLMMYELSIYKEEDREEGRRILRAFMSDTEDETSDQ
jgi:hypothetical protein